MNRRSFLQLSSLSLAAQVLHAQTPVSGVCSPVLKRSYDLANTGCNLAETKLTPAYVKSNGVRVLGTLQMAGDARGAEAQPLVVPSVMMPDGFAHDLIVVADMAGSIWCWDGSTFALLWMQHLANPIKGTAAIDSWGINDFWCFLSTPVVDPTTNILYAVGWQSPDGTAAKAMHYFHAINLKDGSRNQPPINLAAAYRPASGPLQLYSATLRKQRSSLTLATIAGKKTVLWCAGTVAETSAIASGWIFAYDIPSGQITARTFSDTNYGCGVWMAGASPSVDTRGNIYVVTGNGTFDGASSFGECAVKLSYTPPGTSAGSFTIVDWYCPYTDQQREGTAIVDETKIAGVNGPTSKMAMAVNYAGYNDQDLGSAQGCLIESLGLFLVTGKDGICYPVNMHNMGKTTLAQLAAGQQYAALAFPPIYLTYFPGWDVSPDPLNPVALDVAGFTRHNHSTPVQYLSPVHGQMMFVAGENSPVRAFQITATGLTFLAQSNETASAQVTNPPGGMPGMQMTLAASSAGAILICSAPYGNANQTVTNGRLLIYDAENFAGGVMQLLWDSQAEGIPYHYNKFGSLVVSGGKILLPTYDDRTLILG